MVISGETVAITNKNEELLDDDDVTSRLKKVSLTIFDEIDNFPPNVVREVGPCRPETADDEKTSIK